MSNAYGDEVARYVARPEQLTLHELTAIALATCAALGGYAADLSPPTMRTLHTAHAKLLAGLETLAAATPPSTWPKTLAGAASAAGYARTPPAKRPPAPAPKRVKRKRARRLPQPQPRRV
jgi:hypothetical protein